MGLYWEPWTSVSQGRTTPGAPVAAVPWGQSFALFIADPGGGVYAIKAEPGFGWELVPGRSTKPGAKITAVQSGNRFTLFMADVYGEIFTTTGIPYQSWAPWTSVSEGSSTPGAPVGAVPWEGSFALFISDPSGGIYAIKAVAGFGWELVPGHSTIPGAPITALLSGDRFTLFMADVNGEIFTTSGIPYQGWDPWISVSEGSSTPGAPVAAVPWGNSFALFISDPNGGIYAINAQPGFGWELVAGRSTKPGAQVTAVPWTNAVSPARVLLFVADVNGEILMTSGIPYQGWDPWISPSNGSSTAGAPLAAVPSPAQALDFALFIADPSGGVYTTSPTPPPAPTGLHLISRSAIAGPAPGNTEALLGWTAVPAAPGSVYRIDYETTFYDTASPNSGGGTYTSTTDQQNVDLLNGHTFNIYVKAAYFDSNVGVVNGVSAPSNTIVVSALPPTPSISAAVKLIDVPSFGSNYGLFIEGFNFGRSEQISVTVTWTVAGEPGTTFPLGVFTTDALVGSFSTTFTGVTPAGFCPIEVALGQSQPSQTFSVTATDLTSKKTFLTTAGPFTCPFPAP